jgi:hypothetical protein
MNMPMLDNDEFTSLLTEVCGCQQSASTDGVEMLMQNLAQIHEYSGEIMVLCNETQEIEDWVEDKMSRCKQMLSDVKHYLEYRKNASAMHMHAQSHHAPDQGMAYGGGASLGVSHGREGGEKMPMMTQRPEMTPPSAAHRERPGMSLVKVFGMSEGLGTKGNWGEEDEIDWIARVRKSDFGKPEKYTGEIQDLIGDTEEYLASTGQDVSQGDMGAMMYGKAGELEDPIYDRDQGEEVEDELVHDSPDYYREMGLQKAAHESVSRYDDDDDYDDFEYNDDDDWDSTESWEHLYPATLADIQGMSPDNQEYHFDWLRNYESTGKKFWKNVVKLSSEMGIEPEELLRKAGVRRGMSPGKIRRMTSRYGG